jgi:hypothetical protein
VNRPNRIEIVHDGSLDLIALNNTLNERSAAAHRVLRVPRRGAERPDADGTEPVQGDQMNELLLAMVDEYRELVAAGETHRAHLHETEAARRDDGGMQFCGGCRRTVLAKRILALEEASEDVTPQNTPELKGRSRREVIETEIAEALAKEHGT